MKLAIAQLIRESNLIEGFDDPKIDAHCLVAWEWLQTQPVLAISNELICELQRQLVSHQKDLKPEWRGAYRKIDVWVGGRACPDPKTIPGKMNNWLRTYTFTVPRTGHVEFEKIHPFADGNGRTGRMLMWWLEKNRGEPYTQITFAKRQSYYRWFTALDDALEYMKMRNAQDL